MSERTSRIELSWPTVVGGAVAAATGTALASQMGLLGTVIGAALASIVSTTVTAALVGWIEHLRGATRRRDPMPFRGLLVGSLAVTLLVLGFHTGLDLLTQDIPQHSFAGRLLSQFPGNGG